MVMIVWTRRGDARHVISMKKTKTAKRAATKPEWRDPDDAPELTDEMLDRAVLMEGDRVIRRGRPKLASPKQPVTLRLDADIVQRFRAGGPGWQSRINAALRQYLGRRRKA
jgi:uncharacterized protein (DUF4415 family)